MNFAALLGCFSGRATPSLRRNPKAHHTNQTRQESTYLSCEVVQTNEATSLMPDALCRISNQSINYGGNPSETGGENSALADRLLTHTNQSVF